MGFAAVVHAHPMLEHAEPRVGSIVTSAPTELRVWFTQEVKAASSTIEVTDARGKRVAAGPARPHPDDPRQLEVPLAPLDPGEYTVLWRVMSADTHSTQGRFKFRVGK